MNERRNERHTHTKKVAAQQIDNSMHNLYRTKSDTMKKIMEILSFLSTYLSNQKSSERREGGTYAKRRGEETKRKENN